MKLCVCECVCALLTGTSATVVCLYAAWWLIPGVWLEVTAGGGSSGGWNVTMWLCSSEETKRLLSTRAKRRRVQLVHTNGEQTPSVCVCCPTHKFKVIQSVCVNKCINVAETDESLSLFHHGNQTVIKLLLLTNRHLDSQCRYTHISNCVSSGSRWILGNLSLCVLLHPPFL